MRSDIVITYGNYNLTDNMDLIESPDFGLLPDVENSFFEQTRNDGQKFQYKRNQKKYLTFTFIMDSKNYISDRDLLATKLNKDKPDSLTISLFKDRYWNAIIDGDTSFVREIDSRLSVEVKLTFVIPDGIAHSTQTKIYTTDSDILTIDNEGTYKSYPIIEATMPADNGVMAFINNRGKILQFGNPDEPDTVDYVESDRVIWDTQMLPQLENGRGWKTNSYQFENLWEGRYKLNANGTRKFGSDGNYHFVTPNSYGTGAEGFKGISYGRKISPDTQGNIGAKNFESRHGIWFETGTIRQTGFFLTELRDKNNQAVCSVVFSKLSSSNNKANIKINVKGNIKNWTFEPTAWNFYTKKGREFSIVKQGNRLDFHVGGIANGGFIHSVRMDSLTDVEVTDVVYYIGVPISGTPLTRMNLTHSTFRKDNVDKVRDIKNLFGEGDILKVDCSSGVVEVNGIEQKGLGSLGNDWDEFYLEPGMNEVTAIYSSWAKKPTVKLYNQEAFL